MNGAEILLKTAAAAGVEICFANPGTTELPLVAALDKVSGIRPVLGLFEGCCTGAADGYGRMRDKPAMTLLHLGPGLANGIANLHNARRARTPVLNLIGEHATWHRAADPPLTIDIEALSRTVPGWQHTATEVGQLSEDMCAAFTAAMQGQVASLIVASDLQWAQTDAPVACPAVAFSRPDPERIEQAARLLADEPGSALVLGGRSLRREALEAAAAIRGATGCDLLAETFPARMERGSGLPVPARIPYFPKAAGSLLSKYHALVLAGANEPVAFFGYQGGHSRFLSDDQVVLELSPGSPRSDWALSQLVEALPRRSSRLRTGEKRPQPPHSRPADGPLTVQTAGAVLAALQPEGAIIVDESITSGGPYWELTADAAPHTLLTLTGGSLGFGLPCAVGAALACPDRPVIDLQADGSALYTCQSLWTMAREQLNVTVLMCVNDSYDILKLELARSLAGDVGEAARQLTDLGRPGIEWVGLGTSMGVSAEAVDTTAGLAAALGSALAEPGPHLIAMRLSGRERRSR